MEDINNNETNVLSKEQIRDNKLLLKQQEQQTKQIEKDRLKAVQEEKKQQERDRKQQERDRKEDEKQQQEEFKQQERDRKQQEKDNKLLLKQQQEEDKQQEREQRKEDRIERDNNRLELLEKNKNRHTDFNGNYTYEDFYNNVMVDNEYTLDELINYGIENGFKLFGTLLQGKGSIIKKETQTSHSLLTMTDIHLSYYKEGEDGEKIEKHIDLQTLLRKCRIKTYNQVIFNPRYDKHYLDQNNNFTVFNLWNGYVLNNEQNKILKENIDMELIKNILDFIERIICNGNTTNYNYIINWLSHILQKPHMKTGVCPFLYTKEEGTGKGSFVEIVKFLVGEDLFIKTPNIDDLIGHFNSHMLNKIVGNYDEGKSIENNMGRQKDNDIMKNTITERTRTYTKKGVDTITSEDFLNIIITSNNKNSIAINSITDRRYIPLEPSNYYVKRITDNPEDIEHNKIVDKYFTKLHNDILNPLIQRHLFSYLYNNDISGVNITHIPNTQLREQLLDHTKNSDINGIFFTQLQNGHFNKQLEPMYNPDFSKKEKKMETGNIKMRYWIESRELYENIFRTTILSYRVEPKMIKRLLGFKDLMKDRGYTLYEHQTPDHRKLQYYNLEPVITILTEDTVIIGRPNKATVKTLEDLED